MEAYREWRLLVDLQTHQSYLQSSYMSTIWTEAGLTADKVPEAGNVGSVHGVHATTPTFRGNYLTSVRTTYSGNVIRAIGAVDLWGVVQEHTDGVYRAEHCRILALRAVYFPEAYACPCGRLLIVTQPASGGCPEGYGRLMVACRHTSESGVFCGEAPPLLGTCAVIGETTLNAVRLALRAYYEVPELPSGVGPWYLPPLPPLPSPVVDDE